MPDPKLPAGVTDEERRTANIRSPERPTSELDEATRLLVAGMPGPARDTAVRVVQDATDREQRSTEWVGRRRRRSKIARAQRSTGDERSGKLLKRGHSRKLMTLDRAIGQATEMLDGFHRYWLTSPTSNDRKINGLGWAIIADKWAMLTGRPTSIVAVKEAELQRPKVTKLAGKILKLVG